jgi:hypothetical protein
MASQTGNSASGKCLSVKIRSLVRVFRRFIGPLLRWRIIATCFADAPNGMDRRMTALERAFHVAKSGRLRRIQDVIASLKREGYSTAQLEGPSLRRQLSNLIKAARQESTNAPRT